MSNAELVCASADLVVRGASMASPLAKQVAACNRRARALGVAGTLTTRDWQQALTAFHGCCAYCGGPPPLTIDHFVPLTWGGGTTQSNTVPACCACNSRKGDLYPDECNLAFVLPERLVQARNYLQEVGRWHQESLKRVWEREPKLARAQQAVDMLKRYCEARADETSDPHAKAFALLRFRIFGVEWDPAPAFQVLQSLLWQQEHASDMLFKEACDDVLLIFTAARI